MKYFVYLSLFLTANSLSFATETIFPYTKKYDYFVCYTGSPTTTYPNCDNCLVNIQELKSSKFLVKWENQHEKNYEGTCDNYHGKLDQKN